MSSVCSNCGKTQETNNVIIYEGIKGDYCSQLCLSQAESSDSCEVDTGATAGKGLRYNKNKPEVHQVPTSLILAVAEVLKYGEKKYAKGNWKGGFEWTIPYDCLMRHMMAWLNGQENDEESGLSHLYHAAANIAMLIEFKETHKELDNRRF